VRTIELWRYIVLFVSYGLLMFLYITLKIENRRLRKRVKELEDFIKNERPGNLLRGGRRVGGGSVFPW
jgi:hypothetical protein